MFTFYNNILEIKIHQHYNQLRLNWINLKFQKLLKLE